MTKKDLKVVATGTAVAVGAFAFFWWMRKTQTIPVLSPAIIKWEPTS